MPENNIEKPTEIEFKFKISEENIRDAILNASVNDKVIIIPTFEVYNDEYFENNKKHGFLRRRSVFTFENQDQTKTTKDKLYPRPEFTLEQNYFGFLKYGMLMFDKDPRSHIFKTKIKETYYTLKTKKIVNNIENNDEIEIKSNENGNKFMTKIIDDNYNLFTTKTKRKSFIIEMIGDGIAMFPGCRIEIVSVSKNNGDVVSDYYAEVEFSADRVINKDKKYQNISIDHIMKCLKMLAYMIFGTSMDNIPIESRSWTEIISRQKIHNFDFSIDLNEVLKNG